tara:strand:+ start:143 stop:376 length:234 start_codon:yes stop_codon:yes gene_type:complete
MDEYRIESEGIVMSETSEQRKAQDAHITDMRAKEMARQSYRINGMHVGSTERIAQMRADAFDRTVKMGQTKKGKKKK